MRNRTKENNDIRRIPLLLSGLFLLTALTGCSSIETILQGRDEDVYEAYEAASDQPEDKRQSGRVGESEETGEPGQIGESEETGGSGQTGESERTGETGQTGRSSDSELYREGNEEDGQSSLIYVHVCGAVKKPGLYKMAASCRVGEAVETAGGFTKDADQNQVNLAAFLADGQQIYVPDHTEAAGGAGDRGLAGASAVGQAGDGSGITGDGQSGSLPSGTGGSFSGKVNINTAVLAELTGLSGIGESRAKAILAYREEHGRFASTEEIRQVPGIGDGIYQKIKDLITI